ncbi:cobyric acid synthase [Alkalibacter saccharofermentans]|uniref:Cobyric acid synthase n=1 Tax=Alkalibacter saccharofermentans DSM 14828 TaxID=1120975 RepID=A0A1M4XEZ0_9FIRM|nr:cobyric acid synthase [Alkalibacter saccharofermentans]SHE91772.1 adenosylcobyric acid synthase (glutamine-hydrolysing) [Alkalibacter saccharofermentans DSM 14828]
MRKPSIMFQGTGSSVGKSILTAGISRVLKNRGLNVAPFKSQNMALNSFITADGKEMGRAQVVQAEAAGIEPKVHMNPILLKPSSDVGAQVILMGEVYKNMDAREYHAYKPKLKKLVKSAYEMLEREHDCIVLEGAGSPAEINLREDDLVNMGMAELCDCPVVLIGDIDRGGVFASIYGTYMLLEDNEKERVKGFVINKFRGDITLLTSGIEMLEGKIGIPCLGVVPYFRHHIDDEDSVSLRFGEKKNKDVKIGVLKLPHISNFTDYTPFEMEEDVEIRYIKSSYEFEGIDFLIIPGSKNTIEDMIYLKETGMKEQVLKLHKKGVPIFGICGGYQILGKKIIDYGNYESRVNEIDGLGLIDSITTIFQGKRTEQVNGKLCFDYFGNKLRDRVSGYEIHMGVTELKEDINPMLILSTGEREGAVKDGGLVSGTYLHGIFDNEEPRKTILNAIRKDKGVENGKATESFSQFKEKQYSQLGEVLERSLDIDKIIGIMKG